MKKLFQDIKRAFSASSPAEVPPTTFITQVLEPTGGKILCPSDWFYHEFHRGPRYDWTISREEPSDRRPYTTGVRIQTFVNVKDGTGETAKQFILNFSGRQDKNGHESYQDL